MSSDDLESGVDPDGFTHLDARGRALMVDVSGKRETVRVAVARGRVSMAPEIARLLSSGEMPKGDVLAAARIAGVMAAKRTSDLIPLCHPIMLTSVKVTLEVTPGAVEVEATAKTCGQTGVEMEALTAVSVSALTVYDMCKALDRSMRIGDIRLVQKSGGRSGDFTGS
ncbi:cyclic pyranopterin monophosphate synthase MoaC [Acetobacter sacchari]|uniref:Cyclic pyranopterin monophosphate synthase n=1 Tax=Acetobacter sacchari TaxID=2661687 RepID=A0ABS3LYG7_9PROT|nr:cyclic pyranopterin monophosphate synthase MoaC [Acetobacter sacchari]MBO1360955.1 cyclic pyranopterin monophosphate synthase MoaC [Acetobacter sacchari]